MEVQQFFETTLVDSKTGHSIEMIVIPGVSQRLETQRGREEWTIRQMETLRLKYIGNSDLNGAMSTLAHHLGGAGDFVTYCFYKEVVPFVSSPLRAEAIADIIKKAGGVGFGAYIGCAVAGMTPYLFITVPLGMIICGAAAGVGSGLEKGLTQLLRRKLVDNSQRR